jgi:hypothetical protein
VCGVGYGQPALHGGIRAMFKLLLIVRILLLERVELAESADQAVAWLLRGRRA